MTNRVSRDPASGGVYTLLIRLDAPAETTVGALGERRLGAGWYAYTGSALGPGGFARVNRHRELAAGDREVRHWHVDYLLGHPDAALAEAVTTPGTDAECPVARAVDATPVAGFGASDCGCGSHLAFGRDRRPLEASVRAAHRSVQG